MVVDYTEGMDQMVLAGQYDQASIEVNTRVFHSGHPCFELGQDRRVSVELLLESVGHLTNPRISNVEVVAYRIKSDFSHRGLRSATVQELLAFGKTYPEIQRRHTIVALGSDGSYRRGHTCVPYLDSNRTGRILRVRWYYGINDEWMAGYRFLAVRK